MDKVELGRRGEMFVMKKLLDRGWTFPDNYPQTITGSDWFLNKNNRDIKIQVKTSQRDNPTFSLSDKGDFDYLIFTNLIDVWIIPREIINNTNKLNPTFKKLRNAYDVLECSRLKLLALLMDYHITPSEMGSTAPFFKNDLICRNF